MTDIVAASLAAVRHADALMRKTAIGPDESHTDWQPMYGKKPHTPNSFKWHPPYGETHIRYSVHPFCEEWPPTKDTSFTWGLRHDGMYQSTQTFHDEQLDGGSITLPQYSHEGSDVLIRGMKSLDQAKAAAHEHFRQNYGQPPKHDYDIDSIMDDNPQAPAGGKRGLGDDEDYSRIFDASRLDPADIYRLAGDGLSYEDTMKLIDEQLAGGEPEDKSDYSTDYRHEPESFETMPELESVPDPTCHLPSWINNHGECEHPDHDYACHHCGQTLEQHQDRDCPDQSGRMFEPGDNLAYPL